MSKKIKITLVILGVVVIIFFFVRPPVAKMYCANKYLNANIVLDRFQGRLEESLYETCVHKWGL